MSKLKRLFAKIEIIASNIRTEHIGAFGAQSAFFLILSFIPMIMLILSALKSIDVDYENIYALLSSDSSGYGGIKLKEILDPLTLSLPTVISISTLFTAWSAGRAFHALSEGFLSILGCKTSKSYLFLRIRSLLFSLLFAVIIAFIIIIGLFGSKLQAIIVNIYSSYEYYPVRIIRVISVCLVIFVIVIFLYRFLPFDNSLLKDNTRISKPRLKPLLISSLLSAAVIYIFTLAFSLYVTNFANYANIYGGMTVLVCIMLWLYGTMYVVFLGFRLLVYLTQK